VERKILPTSASRNYLPADAGRIPYNFSATHLKTERKRNPWL